MRNILPTSLNEWSCVRSITWFHKLVDSGTPHLKVLPCILDRKRHYQTSSTRRENPLLWEAMQTLLPNGRNNIEVFLSKHWSLIAQQKMCYRMGGRVDAIDERMRKIMLSILRWVIYRLLWILRRTVIPYHEDFKFYPKNTKSKRMNWLSKEIKMYIFKFFQRKNSRWFWLYFVVTITIIQKNHRPSVREHPSDLVLHLIGREIGMSFLDHSTGEYASDEFLYWLGEKMAWVFWSNHRALQIQSRMAFDNQW